MLQKLLVVFREEGLVQSHYVGVLNVSQDRDLIERVIPFLFVELAHLNDFESVQAPVRYPPYFEYSAVGSLSYRARGH